MTEKKSTSASHTLSLFVAGFVTVLVGITSSIVLVIQAAQHLGANTQEVGSWIWALGLGMGVFCIGFSWYYKKPVVIAWSTASAALILATQTPTNLSQAYGAFIIAGLGITLIGFTGWFEKVLKKIPQSIGAAMLAGILLPYGLDIFKNLLQMPELVGAMMATYLLVRLKSPRYCVIAALIVGSMVAYHNQMLHLNQIEFSVTQPIWISPEFTWQHTINLALPLFLVTMTSQNIPGITISLQAGYRVAISPVIGWLGVASVILAPFGAFSLNLAAISAAICMGEEAHPDAKKRYIASMIAGGFYLLIGIFGLSIASLFLSLPKILVMSLAGLALLSIILSSLNTALAEPHAREAALLTLLCTASGIKLLDIGSAFWGLVLGILVLSAQYGYQRMIRISTQRTSTQRTSKQQSSQ